MVATVRLNSKPDKESDAFKNIKESAKHEAIHLLLFRLEQRGFDRFTSSSAICEASEELCGKLEKLIEQVKMADKRKEKICPLLERYKLSKKDEAKFCEKHCPLLGHCFEDTPGEIKKRDTAFLIAYAVNREQEDGKLWWRL